MIPVTYNANEPYILMADDDEDDTLFMSAALKAVGLIGAVHKVNNGAELIIYLKDLIQNNFKLPALIILDLNMPQKNGKDVLKIVKSDERLKHIPIVVYTTSNLQPDMLESYRLGCNGYIIKPNNYSEIETIAAEIKKYFIDTTSRKGQKGGMTFTLNI